MASKKLVESLYEALARGDSPAVAALMAADLEWWFHGPRRCQYMRKLLTGEEGRSDFRFRPRSGVAEVGRWVVAEGWEGKHAYWVHAWMVEDGLITRFREYFNTCIAVHEVAGGVTSPEALESGDAAGRRGGDGSALWQSKVRTGGGRSLPGLVLAI